MNNQILLSVSTIPMLHFQQKNHLMCVQCLLSFCNLFIRFIIVFCYSSFQPQLALNTVLNTGRVWQFVDKVTVRHMMIHSRSKDAGMLHQLKLKYNTIYFRRKEGPIPIFYFQIVWLNILWVKRTRKLPICFKEGSHWWFRVPTLLVQRVIIDRKLVYKFKIEIH